VIPALTLTRGEGYVRSSHPHHPPPVPPEVITIRESIASVITDLGDVTRALPGDARRCARILDRLSEELAECAGMARALPGRPEWARGYALAVEAALRTARDAGEDPRKVAERALARLDAEDTL
jgi:hypothetical protein